MIRDDVVNNTWTDREIKYRHGIIYSSNVSIKSFAGATH